MEITRNTTGMDAAVNVFTDKEGNSHCVVVTKATFHVDSAGALTPAEEPLPLVKADEHHGEPASTSLKYECEFAPYKPRVDVLFNAVVFAPSGKPVTEVAAAIAVGSHSKKLRVVGDRHFTSGFLSPKPSAPKPFTQMPLIFERTFGGTDVSHADKKHHGAFLANPVGCGFWKNPDASATYGKPVPNILPLDRKDIEWRQPGTPVGLNAIGRSWSPRLHFAGTYDDAWKEHVFPFLPKDFDEQYFQCAPVDQQFPVVKAGETIATVNLHPSGKFAFRMPDVSSPVLFRTADKDIEQQTRCDTVLVEAHLGRVMLTSRTRLQLGRKWGHLREIWVGPRRGPKGYTRHKPHYVSLGDLANSKRGSDGESS